MSINLKKKKVESVGDDRDKEINYVVEKINDKKFSTKQILDNKEDTTINNSISHKKENK